MRRVLFALRSVAEIQTVLCETKRKITSTAKENETKNCKYCQGKQRTRKVLLRERKRAHRPLRSMFSLCCSISLEGGGGGRRVPHPVQAGGGYSRTGKYLGLEYPLPECELTNKRKLLPSPPPPLRMRAVKMKSFRQKKKRQDVASLNVRITGTYDVMASCDVNKFQPMTAA